MAVGPSGRVVIEIDPALKKDLHDALRDDDVSLRDWFLTHVRTYLNSHGQLRLNLSGDDELRLPRTPDEISSR